ncbi:hypothetical protein [Tenacibaculum caenipelagi]|uniref:Uncharacterized protein n=1 Tax=Tenacibaculum caenipelagi TaxID=1325435 RepID=A0A4R6TCV2_9FLAO|nr:hypothetical protein [Tenacibaculum caenipelagi]TDQ22781.1 hypothetical protein DFQ07_2799 [Tenacibaculum caenipelagi]
MSKKKSYKDKFENSNLISDKIKENHTNLIIDLEREAEEVENKFKNEIKSIDVRTVENIFSQYALC